MSTLDLKLRYTASLDSLATDTIFITLDGQCPIVEIVSEPQAAICWIYLWNLGPPQAQENIRAAEFLDVGFINYETIVDSE